MSWGQNEKIFGQCSSSTGGMLRLGGMLRELREWHNSLTAMIFHSEKIMIFIKCLLLTSFHLIKKLTEAKYVTVDCAYFVVLKILKSSFLQIAFYVINKLRVQNENSCYRIKMKFTFIISIMYFLKTFQKEVNWRGNVGF